MNDLSRRIHDAGSAIQALRGPLLAGEPWPLSDTWGTEPEADWGPPELLGHVDEMLPYWIDELEDVLAGDPTAAIPFGRIASDASRLARIDADRHRPIGDLLRDIAGGVEQASAFADRLSAEDEQRLGVHPSRGDITVRDAIERFLAAHLEDHVEQLGSILARQPA
ncbi:MAG TPA: hypothetical protein VM408_04470 [Methylomirabilota bacterium]|nr:hypothetical protein [Methylomirabilota bacterium]